MPYNHKTSSEFLLILSSYWGNICNNNNYYYNNNKSSDTDCGLNEWHKNELISELIGGIKH